MCTGRVFAQVEGAVKAPSCLILSAVVAAYSMLVLAALLGGIDAASIAGFCSRHSLPAVSEKGVMAFGLLFWNVRTMGFEDVRKHLRMVPEGATYASAMTMDPEQVLSFAEMLLARRRDYHVLAAMPRHPDMSMAVPEG